MIIQQLIDVSQVGQKLVNGHILGTHLIGSGSHLPLALQLTTARRDVINSVSFLYPRRQDTSARVCGGTGESQLTQTPKRVQETIVDTEFKETHFTSATRFN